MFVIKATYVDRPLFLFTFLTNG